ncbi:hypothetical protein Q1695_004741 [Nippostrongylus brasiliensis]|nr:hypothetical protein Q1695_004741 [Nippostrongylus brasiliensis]
MQFVVLFSLIVATVYCLPAAHVAKGNVNKRESLPCEPTIMCHSNEDCRGGVCVGALVNKCSCHECMDGFRCDNDAMCGGLKGACDLKTDLCNCTMGFVANGFTSMCDALLTFCNLKECTKENAAKECFGLPCNAGVCVCDTV